MDDFHAIDADFCQSFSPFHPRHSREGGNPEDPVRVKTGIAGAVGTPASAICQPTLAGAAARLCQNQDSRDFQDFDSSGLRFSP